MAVPCGDERDHKFAQHFNIPITNIIGKYYNGEEANPTKDAILENSDFLNGMVMKDAIDVAINKIEEIGIGKRKVNYKMRDAAFSRQRYWGEPFPIKWINGIAYPLDESELPLELPNVDSYKPGPEGEGPLANIPEWIHKKVKLTTPPQTPPKEGLANTQSQLIGDSEIKQDLKQSESEVSPLGRDLKGALETNTMPGYAGSSWYFLRYMDPHNDKAFCDRKVSDYWGQVDLYIGGTEHAVGHLLYSRMWTKTLYDLGYIGHDEPYKKLVNQGMIQGSSRFVYRVNRKGIEKIFSKFLENYYYDLNFQKEYVVGDFVFDFGNIESKILIEIKSQKLISKTLEILEKLEIDSRILLISNEEFIDNYIKGNAIELKNWFDKILGHQEKIYASKFTETDDIFVSKDLLTHENKLEVTPVDYVNGLLDDEVDALHVDVNIVDGLELNINAFTKMEKW